MQLLSTRLGPALAGGVLAVACGASGGPAADPEPRGAAQGAAGAPESAELVLELESEPDGLTAGSGRVGRVRWLAEPLELLEVGGRMRAHVLASWPEADLADASFELGPGGGLANAVVSAQGGGTSGSSGEALALDVVHRRFQLEPRVQVAEPGDRLILGNADEALHNSRVFLGERTLANHAVQRGQSIAVVLDEPGLVGIQCDLHPWTRAWVWVVPERRHAAVSGPDGALHLELPPGADPPTLTLWHERLGSRRAVLSPRPAGPLRVVFGE